MEIYTILYKFIGEGVHGALAKKKKTLLTGEVETCENSLITCQSDSVGAGTWRNGGVEKNNLIIY